MNTRTVERDPHRRVDSGTWPLYIIILVCSLTGSMVQLVTGAVPPSVANTTPAWYDKWFMVAQPVGAAIVLFALLRVRALVPSLQLERIGCIINATVGLIYFAAVTINNGGPPTALATWMLFGFAYYSAYRTYEITKAFGVDILAPFRRARGRRR